MKCNMMCLTINPKQ